MRLRSASLSKAGAGHADNKDSFFADDSLGLYMVSDGIGTSRPSEVASRLAVETLSRSLAGTPPMAEPDIRSWLGKALQKANEAILEKSRGAPELVGIGCTLTLLRALGASPGAQGPSSFAALHVGDSRAYRLSREGLKQITDDHTVVYDLYRSGVIQKEWIGTYPDRHLLTRALGTGDFVIADILMVPAEPGDRFLLATDGVVELLDDEELAIAVDTGENVEAGCRRAVELAVKRGSRDDVTAILVRVEPGEEASAPPPP